MPRLKQMPAVEQTSYEARSYKHLTRLPFFERIDPPAQQPSQRSHQHLRRIPEIIVPRELSMLNNLADQFLGHREDLFPNPPHIGGNSKRL